jgi:hypothetical protein
MSRILWICLSSLLVISSPALADEGYRPDEFLGLDLSKAALSPKPLGPANTFGTDAATVPAGARAASDAAKPHADARAPHPVRTVRVRAEKPSVTAQVSTRKPRGAARTRLAHRHRNPLDAQARDTRIQVWPCKSGGICKWKQ